MQNIPTTSHVTELPRRSYRQLVRDQLRDAILSGELRAGEHLNEVSIAKRFGVSATPVREAFRELEQSGLLVGVAHRGAVVRSLTRKDLGEMYSLRAHLERLAIRLALPRLDARDFNTLSDLARRMERVASKGEVVALVDLDVSFHRHIVQRSDHELLLKTWEQIHPSQWTYVTVRFLAAKGPLYIAQRHWPLLEVLRRGQSEEAQDVVAHHIDAIGKEVLELFRTSDDITSLEAEESDVIPS